MVRNANGKLPMPVSARGGVEPKEPALLSANAEADFFLGGIDEAAIISVNRPDDQIHSTP
jgi:hypothetical protein